MKPLGTICQFQVHVFIKLSKSQPPHLFEIFRDHVWLEMRKQGINGNQVDLK